MSYRVVITRETDNWLADVPGLAGAHTYARTLHALDRAVRETIVLAANLPDDAVVGLDLDYDYRTGDPDIDATSAEVRAVRAQAEQLSSSAMTATAAAARKLVEQGIPLRDVAALLDISPQRVSQLTATRAS